MIAPRENRRIECEVEILHGIVIHDIWCDGKIFNFSKYGLYFESDEQIIPCDEISITIKNLLQQNSDDTQKTFDVEILWRKELIDSPFRYGYGAKLIQSNRSLIKLFDIVEFNNIEFNNHYRKDATDEKDSRAHNRKIFNRNLKLLHNRQIFEVFVTNISRGGAFIESNEIFQYGAKITLNVPGKKIRKDVRINGWVVRMDEKGFGVKFDLRSGWKRRGDLDRRVSLERRTTGLKCIR